MSTKLKSRQMSKLKFLQKIKINWRLTYVTLGT